MSEPDQFNNENLNETLSTLTTIDEQINENQEQQNNFEEKSLSSSNFIEDKSIDDQTIQFELNNHETIQTNLLFSEDQQEIDGNQSFLDHQTSKSIDVNINENENENEQDEIQSTISPKENENIQFDLSRKKNFSTEINPERISFDENSQSNDLLSFSSSNENLNSNIQVDLISTDENQRKKKSKKNKNKEFSFRNDFELIDHEENQEEKSKNEQKNSNENITELLNNEKENESFLSIESDRRNENSLKEKQIDQSSKNSFENILSDGTLRKQILIDGNKDSKPKRSYFVKISYKIVFFDQEENKEIFMKTIENENYFLCENDLIEAIDLTLQTMNENEKCFIQSDLSHCYGISLEDDQMISSILKRNQQQYQIEIDLELHQSISPFNIHEFTIEERLHWGDRKRKRGNLYFYRQDYSTSIQCYYGALRFIDLNTNPTSFQLTDNDQRKFLQDFIEIQNNLAQVFLEINDYHQCLLSINSILQHDQDNSQALFRQGQVFIKLGKYQDAYRSLKHSLKNQINLSNNDEINQMIIQCQNHLEKEKIEEKQLHQRMFSNLNHSENTKNIHFDQPLEQNQKLNSTQSKTWLPYFGLAASIVSLSLLFYFYKNKNIR